MTKPRFRVGWLMAAFMLFTKGGKLLASLKLLKVAKPLITFGTMTLSAFAYAFWLGPWFSIGFVLMLFIHEMGHVIAMRKRGYPAPTPVFIPFLGAAVFAPKFKDRDEEAYIGYGGPLLGSLAALALFGVWFLIPPESTTAHLVLIVSYAATYLNLFNLIPISPLDGGRVTQAVGMWFKYLGLLALAGFSVFLREPAILLIWILVLSEFRFKQRKLQACLGVFCTGGMITLMALGFSSQPFWLDVMDVLLATAFTGGMIYYALQKGDEPLADDRPVLSAADRQKWLWLYLILAAALIGLMVLQYKHLPVKAITGEERQSSWVVHEYYS